MTQNPGIRRLVTLCALAIVVVLLSACVGQSEEGAAARQASAKDLELATVQQKLAATEKAAADLQVKLAAKEKAAEGSAGSGLITVKSVPKPAAAPAPPPAPAGAPAAPKPSMPASYNQPVPFFFYVETLVGGHVSDYGLEASPSCVVNGVFKRGMKIVWRFEIVDTSTGKRVTGNDGATVKIRLPHGQEINAKFGQRAGGKVPDAPWMWVGRWDIPTDYPLGGVDYTITVATKDGRTYTWKTPALVFPDGQTDSRMRVVS